MATLKINKDKISATPNIAKAPIRRADPAKRDRTVTPPKAVSTTSQRNHRFDGKAHGDPFVEPIIENLAVENNPAENRTLRSEL